MGCSDSRVCDIAENATVYGAHRIGVSLGVGAKLDGSRSEPDFDQLKPQGSLRLPADIRNEIPQTLRRRRQQLA